MASLLAARQTKCALHSSVLDGSASFRSSSQMTYGILMAAANHSNSK